MGTPIVVEVSVLDKLSAHVAQMNANMTGFVNNTERSLNNLTKGFVAVAGIGGIASALTGFYMDVRREAQESIEVQNKLDTALGFTSEALKKQAEEVGKGLKIKADEITAAQASLANYIKEEDSIKRLIPAITNLAAAKRISLVDAADKVGKAINTNTESIGKYGIAIEGAAGSVERADSAIKNINLLMGGQAQAVANAKDKLNEYSTAWDEIKEKIGKAFQKESEADHIALLKTQNERIKGFGGLRDVYEKNLKAIADYEERQEEGKQKSIDDARIAAENRRSEEVEKIQAKLNEKTTTGRLQNLYAAYTKEYQLLEGNLKAQALRYELFKVEQKEIIDKYDKKNEKKLSGVGPDRSTLFRLKDEYEENRTKSAQENTNKLIGLAKERAKKELELREKVHRYETWANEQKYRAAELDRILLANRMEMAGNLFSALAGANKRNAMEAQTIARVEAGINTAVAITKALPDPWLVAYAGAMGIAQQIAISNARFAGGIRGSPGVWATVGEHGPENMYIPQGASIFNNTETRTMNNNNSTILNVFMNDHTGKSLDTFRAQLRSGAADQFVRDLKYKMERAS